MTSQTTITQYIKASRSKEHGFFTGVVRCEWIRHHDDDRHVMLLQPFSYTAPNNQYWYVPKGEIVDGASIPRWLWFFIGAPYVGDYREASVIHDYYCLAKARAPYSPTDVHRMFYWACLAGGVSKKQAQCMHFAVHWFGPHWEGEQFYGSRIKHYARQLLPHNLFKRFWNSLK